MNFPFFHRKFVQPANKIRVAVIWMLLQNFFIDLLKKEIPVTKTLFLMIVVSADKAPECVKNILLLMHASDLFN